MKKSWKKQLAVGTAATVAATPMLAVPGGEVAADNHGDFDDDTSVPTDQVPSQFYKLAYVYMELSDYDMSDAQTSAKGLAVNNHEFNDNFVEKLANFIYSQDAVQYFENADAVYEQFNTHYEDGVDDFSFGDFTSALLGLYGDMISVYEEKKDELDGVSSDRANELLQEALDEAKSNAEGSEEFSALVSEGLISNDDSNALLEDLLAFNIEGQDENTENVKEAQAALAQALYDYKEVDEGEESDDSGSGGYTPPSDDEEPTEEEGSLDIGGSAEVVSEEDDDGRTYTRVRVNADSVADSVKDKTAEEVSRVRISADDVEGSSGTRVSVPKQALDAIKEVNQEATVEFSSSKSSYEVPASEFDDEDEDVEFEVNMSEVSEEEADELFEGQTSNRVGPVVDFSITANYSDGSSRQLTRYNSYATRNVTLDADYDYDSSRTTAVVFTDGETQFVPSIFSSDEELGNSVAIKRRGDTRYSVVENEADFTDINDLWNEEQVQKLGNKLIVQGKEDGSFAPQDRITRNEFAALVARSLGLVADEDYESGLTDVSDEAWYSDYVEVLHEAGIVEGHGDGTFRPYEEITRVEIAAMVGRALDYVGFDESKLGEGSVEDYSDLSEIPSWAHDTLSKLYQSELMQGTGSGDFQPYRNATRAEMAKVVHELLVFVEFMNE
ncbi:S-layer homology domain-containing protein [Alkalibacillus aidingensis]|uniref:S-layer homology domain-containing protein n=1 Tax=Alkalibacillus aidingensis TaxID=2747607 RepID=UPI0016607877|nr:S-layer homology domain-containing protein [Alkalibacillus aidingensis]